MRIALTSVLMSALVNASPSSVAASTIIYSNLSPTGTYICCTGWLVGTSITINYSVAMDFTVSGVTLDTVEVALSEIDPSSVTLNFASDNNGLPGGVIETFVPYRPSAVRFVRFPADGRHIEPPSLIIRWRKVLARCLISRFSHLEFQ